MTRVLLLGAQGFLGSAAWRRLAADGHQVQAHAARRSFRGAPAIDGPLLELDLESARVWHIGEVLDSVRPEVVVNCAGRTTGDVGSLRSANVVVTQRLLQAMARHPEIRYVHIGSAAEYGPTDDERPVRETDRARPVTPYGISKLVASNAVLQAGEDHHLRGTILRVFNPIGAGGGLSGVTGRAAEEIRRAMLFGGDTIRLGDLGSWRDYVAVGDVAAAVSTVVGCASGDGVEIFNVARGEALLTRDVVHRLAELAGFHGTIAERPTPGSGRSAGVDWQQADISAMAARFGWRPMLSIDDALTELWCGGFSRSA